MKLKYLAVILLCIGFAGMLYSYYYPSVYRESISLASVAIVVIGVSCEIYWLSAPCAERGGKRR